MQEAMDNRHANNNVSDMKKQYQEYRAIVCKYYYQIISIDYDP